jgi:DNA-directed RNA polymerase subunit H (RpoH/RPB5)
MEDRAIQQLKVILERQGAKIDTVETVDTTDKFVVTGLGEYHAYMFRKAKVSEKDVMSMGTTLPNMILIAIAKPSETVEAVIREQIAKGRIRMYFHLKELQFDITQHRMFPPHFLFDDTFKKANPKVVEQFNRIRMKDPDNELPRMDSLDIGARLVGARPGDIVYIQRHSDTIGQAYVFRRVVKDANVDQ